MPGTATLRYLKATTIAHCPNEILRIEVAYTTKYVWQLTTNPFISIMAEKRLKADFGTLRQTYIPSFTDLG
jgi:hypothetical protein